MMEWIPIVLVTFKLLVFGTGWGLAPNLVSEADVRIEPIRGAPGADFNHLSVRAACAIALDRLRG